MSRHLYSLLATLIAISLTGFTAMHKEKIAPKVETRFVTWYAVMITCNAADEKVYAKYTFQTTAPVASQCPNVGVVCWFTVTDTDGNGVISQFEFAARANSLDLDMDGRISDDIAETAGVYQEKSC